MTVAAVVLPLWGAVEERRLRRRIRRRAGRRRHRCHECRRPITDPVSLRFKLGSGCRRKLGITGRRLQVGRTIRVRGPGHVTGQLDLLTFWRLERISA
ncbi:hypothetical protein ACGFIV_00820 [Sphaerisporangium sp. NPDC049003]|uniref:hypothetical protein n=1 Tax=Sphaerisporangium sp. NPDC049003 TaxID=3364517 RepID=UPI00371AEEC0